MTIQALFKASRQPPVEAVDEKGALAHVDALAFCRAIKKGVVDLAFIDPPFNLGKDYGLAVKPEALEADLYQDYIEKLLVEVVRTLKPGGALFLYHLPYWASRLSNFLQERLDFRHWIAIAMKNGFARGSRLYPAHYALLYYSKGEPASFRRPRLRPQLCRHCSELVKDYGGYTNIVEEKGLNLSDFWEDLSPVRHASKKLRRGNQLPLVLTDRVFEIASQPGGVFLDPFVGTGTSLISAAKAEMFFLANDLDEESLGVAKHRLKNHM